MTASRPQNPPRRHHFLPECYQKLWTGDDGRLERFTIGYDEKVRSRRLAPASIGWSQDLYRIPGIEDPWAAQSLETEFFGVIDTAAARIMRLMRETGNPPQESADRSAWAMFVLSFLHRTPEHLDATVRKMTEMNRELMPKVEASYDDIRGPKDPPTFAEWQAQRPDFAIERNALQHIAEHISNSGFGTLLINLEWEIIDLSMADHRLMTSDNPVILVPLKLPDGHLAIALGPDLLFVASRHKQLLREIRSVHPRKTARIVNRLMVERAVSVVVAKDDRQALFVRRYFGTCRIGSLATGLIQPERALQVRSSRH